MFDVYCLENVVVDTASTGWPSGLPFLRHDVNGHRNEIDIRGSSFIQEVSTHIQTHVFPVRFFHSALNFSIATSSAHALSIGWPDLP